MHLEYMILIAFFCINNTLSRRMHYRLLYFSFLANVLNFLIGTEMREIYFVTINIFVRILQSFDYIQSIF